MTRVSAVLGLFALAAAQFTMPAQAIPHRNLPWTPPAKMPAIGVSEAQLTCLRDKLPGERLVATIATANPTAFAINTIPAAGPMADAPVNSYILDKTGALYVERRGAPPKIKMYIGLKPGYTITSVEPARKDITVEVNKMTEGQFTKIQAIQGCLANPQP